MSHRLSTEEQIRAAHIGELSPLVGNIHIADYDPAWPRLFEREVERIRAALGDRVLLLEHVGSTSVPGLAAKPRIDMLLVVTNSANEPTYVPALESAGYVLLFRNWLRDNPSDRQLYERTKRELASRDWKYTQNYADAKTEVVEEILARAWGDNDRR